MNRTLIQELQKKCWQGTITFPEVVRTLGEDGVTSYHVDYLRGEMRYYYKNGESTVEKSEHFSFAVSDSFSPEKLQALIKSAQAGTVMYPEFIKESSAIGCSYYIVYIVGGKVRYFGKDGGEHVEPFPGRS